MEKMVTKISVISLVMCILLAACSGLAIQKAEPALKASGTIAADSTRVSAEIGGKLLDIKVNQGDTVKTGDVLFRLDDEILQAQHDQAAAAVTAAQAAVDAAQSKLANAQAQFDLAVLAARAQDRLSRASAWTVTQPDKFKQPVWYFQKSEQIIALQTEVATAQKALSDEQANLQEALKKASNEDFVSAEKDLAAVQAAYQVANLTLEQAKAAKDNTNLVDAAQKILDATQSELDTAQQSYNKMLSTSAATDVLEARARLSTAQARLDNANDAYDQLLTGDDSVQVQVAQTGIDQAKSAVTQAQAALAQAQAAVKLLDVQIAKTTVSAPTGGIVLSRPQNPGEITAAGATVVEIGSLDQVKLTVYIPEDQYGKIKLGQAVKIAVDSFQGRTFTGSVTLISNQAEFTPRNVQTVESRSTTVYAVEISINNPQHDLKDGMPADATF
jgi:multidrug resistance efflux pump